MAVRSNHLIATKRLQNSWEGSMGGVWEEFITQWRDGNYLQVKTYNNVGELGGFGAGLRPPFHGLSIASS